jgi:hypothetical protein
MFTFPFVSQYNFESSALLYSVFHKHFLSVIQKHAR